MRFGGKAGCVIKDNKVYLPLWREATKGRTMMSTKPYQLRLYNNV